MSGKNNTTGYSQVRWEMIWRFALCVVPTSVGLYDIKRHSETSLHKKALLLTKPPNCTSLCQQNQLMTK
jgi:hypothetical protein